MAKKMEVMDGNQAAAYVSYAFTEVAGIYPITPSSQMAEHVDEWASKGKKNIFGTTVNVVEMQSEGGAAGTVHGSLQSGALTSTYTASQGLLLMIPNMYKIAGELLPSVFHVSARTLSAHALSIFGDHSDVMGCRMTGFAMLAASSPQEVMDMGAVAHLSTIKGKLPFLHFFDGFRTSHEQQKIEVLDYDDLAPLVDMDAVEAFRKKSLNPEHPSTRGTTVNPDIFFQCRESCNEYFDNLPDIVEGYMEEINKLTGRNYKLFEYYGAEDAEHIIIAMCSITDVIKETVDYLCAQGKKVGLINVHLYRPFSAKHFLSAIPKTTKKIAVLDRTKEPGSIGEPLFQDVSALFKREGIDIQVVGGRYGLSSKDTTPSHMAAVYENLEQDNPKDNFTVAINDDVYFSSLEVKNTVSLDTQGLTACKIWGLGSDGTVGANKNSIKIIGDTTDLYSQAYFVYDSKKSNGLTQSHLRFGKDPIRSPYLVTEADFVGVHNQSYVDKYDLAKDLKPGGTFLLNTSWTVDELDQKLPAYMKRQLAEKNANFYVVDATAAAKRLGLGSRTNTVLQAAFFNLVNIIPIDKAVDEMKKAIHKTYYVKKGQKVVDMNNAAVDEGLNAAVKIEIPASWKDAKDAIKEIDAPDFIKDIVIPMNRQEGNDLPVSLLKKHGTTDGTWMSGTTKYEKRGAASEVPLWKCDKCIQCNQCSYVCPHAAIRPILLDDAETKNAPETFATKAAVGKDLAQYQYRMQVSPFDCTGCGSCVKVCPSKEKALEMTSFESQKFEQDNWNYGVETVTIKKDVVNDKTVKMTQFAKPYFEFSGACSGCGQTPYIKLITQLFGDSMIVGNASGCSSAYGGSTPATPYCTDEKGHGPAWAMSLFEDNAEYSYGFLLGHNAVKTQVIQKVEALIEKGVAVEESKQYLENKDRLQESKAATENLVKAIEKAENRNLAKTEIDFLLQNREYISKKSVWAFGGDGWAYDIGYGGLDHVLASGDDINVLVMDTEVYSNTGGQSSKGTVRGAIAKFAASGKRVKKKDLGMMAMSYGYVYVAQVAMGYDQAQTLKAIREAEAYPGPSIVIAYTPCIEHGIKVGMSNVQEHMKNAVESGYWHLYRYNPLLKQEGKNPFQLDSKPPTKDLKEHMKGENRYASLSILYPEIAEELFDKAVVDAQERYDSYLRLADSK